MNTIINHALSGLKNSENIISAAAHNISMSGSATSVNSSTPPTQQMEDLTSTTDHIDLANETISIIRASRAYEANLKVVSVWSDLLENTILVKE